MSQKLLNIKNNDIVVTNALTVFGIAINSKIHEIND